MPESAAPSSPAPSPSPLKGGDEVTQSGAEEKRGAPPPSVVEIPVEAEGMSSSSSSRDEDSAKRPSRAQTRDRVNWLIHLLNTRGEHKECLRLVESQLQSCDGLCEYPIYIKGLVLRQRGQVQEALELFQSAAVLDPASQDTLRQIGRCLFLLGRHGAAVGVLEEAAATATRAREDWQVLHDQGLCYLYLKDFDRAVACFQGANDVQRHDATFIELGKVYTVQERYAEAIEVFLEALDFSPGNAELLTTVGLLYLRCDDNLKAFDFLGNSLTHDPRSPKTILAAGSIIQDHGDMDVALVKYRVAAVATPDSAQLWNNIGMCFFGKERFVAAVACLKRSLYLDPFQWITAHNLGLVHLRTGQFASAFQHLSASVNLKPDFASSYMYLAVVLVRLGDCANAFAAYDKSLALDPNDPVCYLNYAAALHNNGDEAASKTQFHKYSQVCAALSTEERDELMQSAAALHHSLLQIHSAPVA